MSNWTYDINSELINRILSNFVRESSDREVSSASILMVCVYVEECEFYINRVTLAYVYPCI